MIQVEPCRSLVGRAAFRAVWRSPGAAVVGFEEWDWREDAERQAVELAEIAASGGLGSVPAASDYGGGWHQTVLGVELVRLGGGRWIHREPPPSEFGHRDEGAEGAAVVAFRDVSATWAGCAVVGPGLVQVPQSGCSEAGPFRRAHAAVTFDGVPLLKAYGGREIGFAREPAMYLTPLTRDGRLDGYGVYVNVADLRGLGWYHPTFPTMREAARFILRVRAALRPYVRA